ncbi:MAG: Gfo/Idh/MocA family oxidoreductase [Caldilineaceae bacterium]
MYRAAVIGLGRMGSTYDDEVTRGGPVFLPYAHAPSYAAHPHVTLATGADPYDEQRILFGERWGIAAEHLYADYAEMLVAEAPDIVSICTSARHRARIIQACARAGVKAIWAEKPLALTLAEADTVLATCRETGTALAVNCARRWNPFFQETKRLIDAGELGRILQVTGYGQAGLSHNGSHLIDIVRYLAGGDVAWVFGEMESDEAAAAEGDLMGNGYLVFDNDVRGYVRCFPCGPANWEIDVIGEQGRVRAVANCYEMEFTQFVDAAATGRPVPAKLPFPLPPTIQGTGLSVVDDLIRAIEDGTPPTCSGDDGAAALEIAVALRESHRRGGVKVSLPLTDRSLGIVSAELAHDSVPARVRRMTR